MKFNERAPLSMLVVATVAALASGCSTSEPAPTDVTDTTADTSDTGGTVDTVDTVDTADSAEPTDAAAADSIDGADVASDVYGDTGPDGLDAPGDALGTDTAGGPWPIEACSARALDDSIPLPEASGAALLDPTRALVVADSGNGGVAVIFDFVSETTVATSLPLGEGAGDDVEGLSMAPDGRIWGVTSAGWLRTWERDGTSSTFTLVAGPTAVAPLESDWACDAQAVNCGPNYEGLCLHPAPAAGDCAGYLASKATGKLVCVVQTADGAGYEADPSRLVEIATADRISGCSFEPVEPYRLFVGGNVLAASRIWWVAPGSPPDALSLVGAGNQEAVLVTDSGVWSFGDTQGLLGDQSPVTHVNCRP